MATAGMLAGCSPENDAAAGVTRTDSAGVEIVRSGRKPVAPISWVVSDSPAVRIGTSAGDERYELFRAADGTLLASGSIAVLNGGSHEIRFYNAEGAFVQSVGGQGDGPGELQSPRRLFRLAGDSIAVVERVRISWFDAVGKFVHSLPISVIHPDVAFADGSFLGSKFAPGQSPFVLGASRPELSLVRWWPESGDSATVAVLHGDAVYRMEIEGNAIVSYPLGFGPQLTYAVVGDHVALGDGAEYELRILDHQGELRRIYRRTVDPRPISTDQMAAYERLLLSAVRSDNQRALLHRLFGEWTYPEHQPHFDRILVDDEGYLWVHAYAYDPAIEGRWSIFDPEGVWRGEVRTPSGLSVWEIGLDHVLGVSRDASDVEYVALHKLRRN